MEPFISFLLLLVGLLSALVSAISVYEKYQAASKQLKSPESNLISINTDSRTPRKSKRNRRKCTRNQNFKPISLNRNKLQGFTSETDRMSAEIIKTADDGKIPSATVSTGNCSNKIRHDPNSTNTVTKGITNKASVKKPEVASLKSLPLPDQPEDDGLTTTLYYMARSDVRRIKGKGGRLVKALERKYGVKIDVPAQNADGNLIISEGNEAIRRTVEADIRDRMIMTISLPFVDPIVYAKIQTLVDDGKLQIVHQTTESEKRSICFTGLAKHCKEILNVSNMSH
jgi:hypothetical protein